MKNKNMKVSMCVLCYIPIKPMNASYLPSRDNANAPWADLMRHTPHIAIDDEILFADPAETLSGPHSIPQKTAALFPERKVIKFVLQ